MMALTVKGFVSLIDTDECVKNESQTENTQITTNKKVNNHGEI